MLFWVDIDCRVAILILGNLELIKLHTSFVKIEDEIIWQYIINIGGRTDFLPVVVLNILK